MQAKKEHKRNYAVAVGGIFILLAIIGAINIIIVSTRITANLLDNQRQKNEIQDFLTPIVMFDPAPFKKASDIENQRLLLYSMWHILASDNVKNYKRSEENHTLLISASDVEAAAYNIFGDSVKLKHETFYDIETGYFYNEEKKSYEVPTYGFLYVYKPKVTDIKKNDTTYDVVVEYIPPENAWATIYKGEGGVVNNKVMTFELEHRDGSWYLISIRPQTEEETSSEQNNPTIGMSGVEDQKPTEMKTTK